MSVRRGAIWLATVCVAFGATVSLGAAPAAAEGESVRVRAPSTMNAGGSPGSVTVNVSMRGGECVNVRTGLGIRLPGLTADRVEVQVAADGAWRPVRVSDGGDGLVVAARTAPGRPELCARKSVSSRYRVSLLAGAPAGRVTVVAEAYTAAGRLLGRDSDTARVGGRTGTTPSPTRKSPSSEPVESPVATEEAVVPTQQVAAALPDQTPAGSESGSSLGLGAMVMIVGVVMVVIGIALLVLLIRRGRADRRAPAGAPPAGGWQTRVPPPPRPAVYGGGTAGGADPTMMLSAGGGDRTVALPGGPGQPPARFGGAGPTPVQPGGGDPALTPDPALGRRGGGDPTLILPTRMPPRQPRPAPPAPPGSVSPAPAPSGSVSPPSGEPPTEPGPDATLILPPNPPKPR